MAISFEIVSAEARPSETPIRVAMSSRMAQSVRACPGAGRIWLTFCTRPSTLVTVPSFSEKPDAGSTTSALRFESFRNRSMAMTYSAASRASTAMDASGRSLIGSAPTSTKPLTSPESSPWRI